MNGGLLLCASPMKAVALVCKPATALLEAASETTTVSTGYVAKHWRRTVIGGLLGVAMALWAASRGARMAESVVFFWPLMALLCSPFTLRTQAGRVWWSGYGLT